MKKIICLSLSVLFLWSLNIKAQIIQRKSPSSVLHEEAPGSDAKSSFIKNGDYLSESSLKDYNRFYGDSLLGFDEASIKAMLLSNNVFGKEYLGYIKHLKRAYINKKYGIGLPVASSSPAPGLGNRPGNGGNSTAGAGNRPIGGGGNTINVAPCVNEDFEATPVGTYTAGNAVSGWTISSRNIDSCFDHSPFTAGSPEFSVLATPVSNALPNGIVVQGATLGNSPLGGNNIIQMQDINPSALQTKISQTFPVTSANTLFQFAYAGIWQDGTHSCCQQPAITIIMYNCVGDTMACSSLSLNAPGSSCVLNAAATYSNFQSNFSSYWWTSWQTRYIDLTPYVGSCVTIEVVDQDCIYGGHSGLAYFDAECGGALVGLPIPGHGPPIQGPVSFCAGSNQAQINAPLGYSTYQWYAGNPPLPVTGFGMGGNTPVLSISNPVPGTTYTVELVTASGCTYTAVDTLRFSSVQIAGLATASTCPGGASGSATVQGHGSGSGYNYSWTGPNGNTNVVSTASTATGLSAGVYTIIISGYGAAGCGSDTDMVTVGTGPAPIIDVVKPFCGNEAYMSVSGANFQWYNGTSSISASAGGTAGSYTASSPYNGQIYWVTFNYQGCRDSVDFLLVQTQPGYLNVTNTSNSCPGVSNGNATITLIPAANAPGGQNTYSVFSTGNPPSTPYSSWSGNTSANIYVATGMGAGNYSMTAFDGSCKYNTTFSITDYLFDYSVTPVTATLCPGGSILASVNFSVPITPTQYSFQWSPATWVTGGGPSTTNISMQVVPAVPVGSIITQVYSVTVIPTSVYCPITKTISITGVNLQAPSFAPIPSFCNNANTKTITATPGGGTFSTSSGNWLGTFNGQISPALTSIGTNTFAYAISVSSCVVSSIGNFNVAQFNSAALTGSIANQCVTFPCMNLMNIVQSSTNGNWTGPGVGSNTFCPSALASGIFTLTYNTTSSPYPALCPDSRTLAVGVSQPVIPVIAPIKPFCTNIPSFNMVVTPGGGTWSSPQLSLINPNGLVNPAFANPGVNVVNYVVSTGACVNTATTILDATTHHSAALTGSINNLCYSNGPINLMTLTQNQAYGAWDVLLGDTGYAVVNNVLYPQGLSTGLYTLWYRTVSSPNPKTCKDSTKLVVSVLHPTLSTISQPLPHCSVDGTFQLVATPPAGVFVNSPYLSVDGVFTPSLSTPGNNTVQYVVGSATCNITDTKQVSIEAYVPPTLTGSVTDQCNTNQIVDLASLPLNSGGSWTGPGILGNSFNPGTSGTGVVVVMYNTKSYPSGLCPAQQSLAVNVFSLATPVISQVGPFCNSNAGFQLQVTPVGGSFMGTNNSAVNKFGWFNPGASVIGGNTISYSVTAGPCLAYGQSTIQIEQFVSASFSQYPGPFCRNSAPFDLSSAVQNPGGVFAGANLNGSLFDPSTANIGNGNIIHYQTHSMPTALLCPDESTIQIQVNNNPVVTAKSSGHAGCLPLEVNFNTVASGNGRSEWTLGDGSEPMKGLLATHTYTAAGTYTVLLNYWDNLGCSTQTQLAVPITVYELPKAAFTYGPFNEVTISDPQVQFTNQSSVLSRNTYLWQIDNLYETGDVNPSVKFPSVGSYQITLTATSLQGCKDKTSQTIEIKNDFGIYIPNSFTPNDDALNDVFLPVFTPYGLDAKTFDMEIFDRWGASLYHTRDVTKGWNGTMQNKGNDKLKEDVYVYKIKYKDIDGVIYDKLGYVTLIR